MARSISFDITANDDASKTMEEIGDKAEETGRKVREASGTVEVDADTAKLEAAWARLEHKELRLTANISDLERKIAIAKTEIASATGEHKAKLDADITEYSAKLRIAKADKAVLEHEKIKVKADLDKGPFDAGAQEVKADTAALDREKATVEAELDKSRFDGGIQEIKSAIGVLRGGFSIPVALLGLGAVLQLKSFLSATAGGFAAFGAGAIGAAAVTKGALTGIGEAVTALGENDAAVSGGMVSNANNVSRAVESVRRAQYALRQAQDEVGEATRGVTAATEAYADAQYDQARAADAVTRAQDGVRVAEDGVTAAEQGLADAQRDARQVQDDLTDARQRASERLEDLQRRTEDMRMSQASAALSVREAEERLQELLVDPGATDLQRARARLSLAEARRRTETLAEDAQRLADQKAEADRKGIEGSDEVKAALDRQEQSQKRIEAATKSVAAAQRGVIDAQRGVIDAEHQHELAIRRTRDAQLGIADAHKKVAAAQEAVRERAFDVRDAQHQVQEASKSAGTAGSAAANNLQEAMAELTPEGQRFARFLRGLIDGPIKDLKDTAQKNLLPGLQEGIDGAFKNMPDLKNNVADISKAVGTFFKDIGPSVGKAVNGFSRLAKIGAEKGLPVLADTVKGLLDKFSAWAAKQDEKSLGEKMDKVIGAFGDAKDAIHDVWSILTILDGVWKTINFPTDGIRKGPIKAMEDWEASVGKVGGAFKDLLPKDIGPSMTSIKGGLKSGWDWIDKNVFTKSTGDVNKFGNSFGTTNQTKILPSWTSMRTNLKTGADWIKTNVFDRTATLLGGLGSSFGRAKDSIGRAWDGIKEKAASPIRFVINTVINKGIVDNFNKIAGALGATKLPHVPGFAAGGEVPARLGTRGRDSVPALLTPDEHVWTTSEVAGAGGHAHVERLRKLAAAGRLDVSGDPGSGPIARFAAGGPVTVASRVPAVQRWLPSVDPRPYIWGGVGPGGYDCSGLTGEVYARLTGRSSYRRYFTTLSNFGALGFAPGPGLYSIGVSPSHMVGNLGGLAFEAASSRSGIKVGASARSYRSFPKVYHLSAFGTAGAGSGDGGGFSLSGLLSGALGRFTGGWWNTLQAMGAFGQLGIGAGKKLLSGIFDSGGLLQPGMNLAWNGTGRPEPVLSSPQWDAVSRATGVNSSARRGSGGGDLHIHVEVRNAVVGNDRELAKTVVTAIKSAVASGELKFSGITR